MKKRMLVFVLVCLLLPGLAEPITQEDMITIAAEAIAFKWGEEPELLDESKWQLHIFSQPDKQSPQWEIWFEPMEVALNGYALVITQDGRVIEARMQPGTGNPAITPSQVQDSYSMRYGHMASWDAETWISFQTDLKRAAEAQGNDVLPGNLGLFLSQEYAKPIEDMITSAEAIAIASRLSEAPAQVDQAYSGAVLLMDRGEPVWKVQLFPEQTEGRASPFLVEVHAISGAVRGFRQVAADDFRYRLYYVLDRFMPPQDAAAQPLHQATLRPDGKPAFWYSPKAPDYYWEAMDALRNQGEVDQLLRKWEAEYGRNRIFWPLEAQAFYHTIDNTDALVGSFPGLPDEEDISQEQALEIARQAMLDSGMSREELDLLTPAFQFIFSATAPGMHEWIVDFYQVEGIQAWLINGVSINAKTGEVIAVGANG